MAHTPQALVVPSSRTSARSSKGLQDDEALELAAASIRPLWSVPEEPRSVGAPSGRLPVHAVRPPSFSPEAHPVPDALRQLSFGGTSQPVPTADFTAPKLTLPDDFDEDFRRKRRPRGAVMRWLALMTLTVVGGGWAMSGGSWSFLAREPVEPTPSTIAAPAATAAPSASSQRLAEGKSTPAAAAPDSETPEAAAPDAPAPAATKRKRASSSSRRLGKSTESARAKSARTRPREPVELYAPPLYPESPPTPRGPLGRSAVGDNPY